MEQKKQSRLEADGWQVVTVSDFLNLSPEETILVEIKLALRRRLEERSQQSKLPSTVSDALHNDYSDPEVIKDDESLSSLEKLIHAMLAMGASTKEIGQLIADVG